MLIARSISIYSQKPNNYRTYLHAIYYYDGNVGRKANFGKGTWRETVYGAMLFTNFQ